MIVFKKNIALQKHIKFLKSKNLSIGLAPTMGALHHGHKSLMAASNHNCDITVCSIFVNPTQFNERSDFDKYPNTINEDLNMLLRENVDVVFLPGEKEIYPEGNHYKMPYDLGKIANVLEGEKRPGHFEGVVQVVDRLLNIVQPDMLFMGQKDFQQFSIIQRMLALKDSSVELKVCPIIREEDGLALSSRNVRLSENDRADALSLSQSLNYILDNFQKEPVKDVISKARSRLIHPNIRLEYLEIVDGRTLQPIDIVEKNSYAVAVVAAWVGQVRLIDNVILQER